MCALRWNDLDWDTGVLTVARSVYKVAGGHWAEKPTKTDRVRRVSVKAGLETLRRHRAVVEAQAASNGVQLSPDAFMFSLSPDGAEPIPLDLATKSFRKAALAVDVDTHLHALRHFAVTQMIGQGQDIRTVAGRVGHADASVTLRVYSGFLPERDTEADAFLGGLLGLPVTDPDQETPTKTV